MSIKVDHISYTYMPGAPYEKEALKEISLEIKKGEFIAVIGHTGSGKSTLVQHFNGLLHPTKGQVSLDGVDLAGKTKEARAARNKIGMVFQYPEQQLFAETVYEDIAFGPKNMGLPYEEIKETPCGLSALILRPLPGVLLFRFPGGRCGVWLWPE